MVQGHVSARVRSAEAGEYHVVSGQVNGRMTCSCLALGSCQHIAAVLVELGSPPPQGPQRVDPLALARQHAEPPLEPDDYYTELEAAEREWFSLDFGIQIRTAQGVERISLLPLLLDVSRGEAAPQVGAPLVVQLASGHIARVPYARFAPLLEVLLQLVRADRRGKPRISRWQAMDLAETLRLTSRTGGALRELRRALTRSGSLPPRALPERFRAQLRGYQAQGVAWLALLGEHGIGGVLADDMGLGKTLQVLGLICVRRAATARSQPSLIVAPTSVLLSWIDQLAEFVPALRVVLWHGSDRFDRQPLIAGAELVLTSYALLSRDIDTLGAVEWDVAVLDEAQVIKNPRSLAGQAARTLRANQRLAVTGTPLENHLGELWSLFAFVAPGALGSERSFRAAYRVPIERDADAERMASLRRRIAPLLLRRTKQEVAHDLPPKTILTHSIELGDAQRDLYETVRHAVDQRVREEIARRGIAMSKIVVLDALLKLRQVCCDPKLLKLQAVNQRTPSAKREAFFELIETLVAEGRSVLVFSQFVEMLDLLGQGLVKANIQFARLTGATVDRAGQVELFQSGSVPVFLISLKAGGVGLNLTRADSVVHYDPWWNPAVEAQATDRAHRIGQDKPVFVHRLIARGTVEEKIVALQVRKAELARALLAGGTRALELDAALIDELLAPLP